MSLVTRLRLLAAVLGVSAASVAVGTLLFGDGHKDAPKITATRPAGAVLMEELARTRFTNQPTLTYATKDGETLFAWQVKPTLAAVADRPRDILVMVDTSASQAGKPITFARQILTGLAKAANPGDRVAVWTLNLNTEKDTRSLTGGFEPANGDAVRQAMARLADVEYGSGATDLKAGVERAAKAFENREGRQQILLLLGDGESTASPTPITEATRVALGRDLDRSGIQFFAVPLGLKIQANNIHGLATLTGGSVVRLNDDLAAQHGQSVFAEKLKAAFAVPVLRADKAAFGAEVAEFYPTTLPPLRADRATLVVGKLAAPAAAVSLKLDGTVSGQKTAVALSEPLPASQPDLFFLHPMIEQWRSAAAKDAPAILAADRTLALAAEQFRLFKDEFLVQAEWAVSTGRLDQAEKLFRAAAKVDPADRDAVSGLKVVEKMRAGQVTMDQIRKGLTAQTSGTKLGTDGSATKVVIRTLAEQDAKPAAGGAQPPAGSPAQNDLLRDAQARRAIQEDQFKVLVDDTIRKARQLQVTDPDAAYEDLKRQREAVLANDQIGDRVRTQLALQLDAQMRDVQTKGAETKRRVAEERERIARARALISDHERMLDQEVRTQARIEQFKELMKKARYELAQQEAEVMRQERVAQGQVIPPEVLASYTIGQRATNLREHRELVRIRDDRFLLTLMQVEKSFIPYPDEPPVHFPPAAVWRELTANRVTKYGKQSLGEEVPQSLRDLQNTVENKRVKFEEIPANVPLREILDNLSKQFNVNFIVMEEAFKASGNDGMLEKKPTVNQKLNGLTLRSFLDIILAGVNATYIVRPEYIEITTVDRRLEEKVTQVFPVADLIIPIPQSVNQQALYQNLQLQGQQLAIFGQALGAANFLGGLGGGFQGGFGGGGGGIGQLGGGQIGLGGGGLGGGGGGMLGQLGALGQQGQGFGGNQGAGGGILGTTGGQLGQFGNLGGQFGLQGGDQSGLLLQIIIETVARGEWTTPNSQQLQQQPGQRADEETLEILPKKQLNSLGYYPPARALIVRGTGLYHSNSSYKLKLGEAVGGGPIAAAPAANRPGVVAIGPKAPAGGNAPANAGADKPRVVNPKEDPVVLAKSVDRVPDKMWQQALDLSNVTDPGLIVACAEFMMDSNASVHAAELLKANLRKGVANEGWAHDALAVALRVGKGDSNEIMRASMSGMDLDPSDPRSFLLAANAAGDNQRYDLALAYLKRAAALEPNTPAAYTNALALAARTDGVTSDVVEWAATNLFARDWPNDGLDVKKDATAKLATLAKKYDNTPRKAEIDRLVELATKPKRDLMVELRFQGAAVDLDLVVAEPTGGVASATAKRTSGGGVLVSDVLEQNDDRSEVYAAAQAFSGTYRASVKPVIGRPIGNKATLVVTKFAGTDRQVIETHSIDLTNPIPVNITLDGGTRTELASIPADDNSGRTLTTSTPHSTAPSGMSGGTGSAMSSVLGADAGSRTTSALPAVVKPMETKVPGFAPNAPGMRIEQTLTPDRTATKVSINPVFSGTTSVALPKVGLLPGGGD